MRKLIKDQLKACVFADLRCTEEVENGYIIHIPKYNKPRYDIGKMYLVELNTSLLDSHDGEFLVKNNGSFPKAQHLKIYVSRYDNKFIYVDSQGYDYINYKDLSVFWSGWLPTEKIVQIAKL